MSEYGYKVTLEASCGAKRFTVFHDHEFYDYFDAAEEAKDRLNMQYCARCREHHDADEYHPLSIEFGEEIDGEMVWRDHYPTRVDEAFNPEVFR